MTGSGAFYGQTKLEQRKPLMCQFAAEAQRLRNRQSEPQFDGVVACGDLALQPFQAGERVGSGPVLIGSPWGDQVGAQVQVLLWSRGGTIRICRLRSAEVSDTGSAPPIF